MTRCSVRDCDLPIGEGGFVCVVCRDAYCAHHAALCCAADIQCCDDCHRQCMGCAEVMPVSEGKDVGELGFLCNVCLAGSAVIELHLPTVPLVESERRDLVA